MEHLQIILFGIIALMGVVIIGLIVAYSIQKKEAKESEDNLENARYISSEKTRMITERDTKLDIYETDKDILIDEVKRMEKLNDTNIVEIFELKSELSALKAKQPQQCGKCGKWTKPNPVIVEDKPMCQKCFANRVEIETKQPETTKPLDLSNVKPGTKVRLSNGTVAITELTDAVDEVKIDHFYNGSVKFFHHDGTAVNGSDIRIVEVVE